MCQEQILPINGVQLWTTIQGTGQLTVYDLSMPVLFLHGACDPRPCHFIETLATNLSHSTFVSILESGHYPWIEKPDEVKTVLRQFIVDLQLWSRR